MQWLPLANIHNLYHDLDLFHYYLSLIMIIAIDFDGTIVRSQYPLIQGEQPYAGEVIRKLHERGHYIIIWTCRTGDNLLEAINWLAGHDIPFDRINDNHPENIAEHGGNNRKVYADIYIDDKNFGGFPGWPEIEQQLILREIDEERAFNEMIFPG